MSNRPECYKTMGVVGELIEHPSDLAKVPGRIIERRMVRVFSFRTFLTEEFFEMFVKAANQGGEPATERFSNILKEFFMRERKCDDAGLTPKERLCERQILETKELPIYNNLAERTIRKLTTQRNNSFHYDSDAGC